MYAIRSYYENEQLQEQLQAALQSHCPPLLILTWQQTTDVSQPSAASVLTKPIKLEILRYQLQQIVSQQTKQAQQTNGEATTSLGQRHPLKILVAEDNLINQQALEAGASVERCLEFAEKACARFRNNFV